VLNNVKIFNRGLLMRFDKLPVEQMRKNFLEFWRNFK
jgi:hypothetical protein